MSNLTIYKNTNAVATQGRQSSLGQQIASTMSRGFNRIVTNTNGTFKCIRNGEQVGKPIRGEFNAIIVAMLQKPSREFYASAYDPDAKATLPDCWSALGDKPDEKAAGRQSANCATCQQNIAGSGANGKGKACRFKRKIAILLEGDMSGDVYQFNIPAKSLFGDGDGNTHPFESYCRYLVANGTAPDLVVTTIAYNLNSDTMELTFTPAEPISDDQWELVQRAQENPATARLIQLTVGETESIPMLEQAVAEPTPEPKKKQSFFAEEDDNTVDADYTEIEEPKVVKRPAKKVPAPAADNGDLASIVDAWEAG
jgi:hypothetical protein